MIKMILAVDRGNAIGWTDGRLPWKISTDMKRFKELTSGHTVVMGFNTFKSLGRTAGLPNRKNIVLTRKPWSETREHMDSNANIDVISNLDWLTNPVQDAGIVRDRFGTSTCWIIGGASVYDEALDKQIVDEIYLTLVDESSGADVTLKHDLSAWKYFILQQQKLGINWILTEMITPVQSNEPNITFITLKKIQ